jgi:ATP synthase protein I
MSMQHRVTIPRPPVYRIMISQLLVLAPVIGILWALWPSVVFAVLAGAMIEILARTYFGYYAFRYIGAQQMHQVVSSFKRGELGKFVIVAVLFGALFSLNKGQPPAAVFTGYLVSSLFGAILSMRLLK